MERDDFHVIEVHRDQADAGIGEEAHQREYAQHPDERHALLTVPHLNLRMSQPIQSYSRSVAREVRHEYRD